MPKGNWGEAKIAKLTGNCSVLGSVRVRTFAAANLSDEYMARIGEIANEALERVMMVLAYLENPNLGGKQKEAVDAAAKKYYKEALRGDDLNLVKICLVNIQNGVKSGAAGIKIHNIPDLMDKEGKPIKVQGFVKKRDPRG